MVSFLIDGHLSSSPGPGMKILDVTGTQLGDFERRGKCSRPRSVLKVYKISCVWPYASRMPTITDVTTIARIGIQNAIRLLGSRRGSYAIAGSMVDEWAWLAADAGTLLSRGSHNQHTKLEA